MKTTPLPHMDGRDTGYICMNCSHCQHCYFCYYNSKTPLSCIFYLTLKDKIAPPGVFLHYNWRVIRRGFHIHLLSRMRGGRGRLEEGAL
jgi:hypothetical protein